MRGKQDDPDVRRFEKESVDRTRCVMPSSQPAVVLLAMLMRPIVACSAVVAVTLSGCVTANDYAAGTEALKGSPAFRQQTINECVSNNKLIGKRRETTAKVMNVSPDSEVERTFCTRMVAGIVSGRITYRDYEKASIGQVSPAVVRVAQGR